MYQPIRELEADIRDLTANEGIPYETRDEVLGDLEEFTNIAAIIGNPDPLRRFTRGYLYQERKRLLEDDDDDAEPSRSVDDKSVEAAKSVASDGGRDIPLCDCRDPRCKVKRGIFPSRAVDDPDAFLEEHNGDAAAFREARRKFAERVAAYRKALVEARHDLTAAAEGKRGVGEI